MNCSFLRGNKDEMCALSMPETRHESLNLIWDETTIRNANVPPVCVDVPGNIAYP